MQETAYYMQHIAFLIDPDIAMWGVKIQSSLFSCRDTIISLFHTDLMQCMLTIGRLHQSPASLHPMIPHELTGLNACCHRIYVGLNALRTTISEGHANLLILNGSSAASAISSGLIILSDGKDAFAVMSDST